MTLFRAQCYWTLHFTGQYCYPSVTIFPDLGGHDDMWQPPQTLAPKKSSKLESAWFLPAWRCTSSSAPPHPHPATVAIPHHTSQHCYALCSLAGPACLNRSADDPSPPLPASVYHARAYTGSFQKGPEAAPSARFRPSFWCNSALAFSLPITNATLSLGKKCPWRTLSETPPCLPTPSTWWPRRPQAVSLRLVCRQAPAGMSVPSGKCQSPVRTQGAEVEHESVFWQGLGPPPALAQRSVRCVWRSTKTLHQETR